MAKNLKKQIKGKKSNQLDLKSYFTEQLEFHQVWIDSFCRTFDFPSQFEDLGQKKDTGKENYLAVVHLDGNQIGQKFKEKNNLIELRQLSITIDRIVKDAFQSLLNQIKMEWEAISKELSLDHQTIPLIPIVVGGDDLTLVCHGKLGIYFAELLLKAFAQNSDKLTACAGVAIAKTKYPFYRIYQLAKELCENAKKSARQNSSCWLDWQLIREGTVGELQQLRDIHFTIAGNNFLYHKPYDVNNIYTYGFTELLEQTVQLTKSLSETKINRLQQVLFQGEEPVQMFLEREKQRHPNLNIPNGLAPLDAIELLSFYPEFVLGGVLNVTS